MNTNENNKIIADFMGINQLSSNILRNAILNDLTYHNDFNSLMEVVEKIESLGYDTEIVNRADDGGNCFYIYDSPIFSSYMATKIEAVYNGCVEFAKLYNKQSK